MVACGLRESSGCVGDHPMNTFSLSGRTEARTSSLLAQFFANITTATVELREDIPCSKWVPAGTISLHGDLATTDLDERLRLTTRAVRLGGYSWRFPRHETFLDDAADALAGEAR